MITIKILEAMLSVLWVTIVALSVMVVHILLDH